MFTHYCKNSTQEVKILNEENQNMPSCIKDGQRALAGSLFPARNKDKANDPVLFHTEKCTK